MDVSVFMPMSVFMSVFGRSATRRSLPGTGGFDAAMVMVVIPLMVMTVVMVVMSMIMFVTVLAVTFVAMLTLAASS
ncbi:hypothetical protein GCWU000246_01036 [Jonquetella anthropi E3_33 E1]|nr:hypothetical protein GCWU000246_01036 [Jonquetella anthropi E3_33 E1]